MAVNPNISTDWATPCIHLDVDEDGDGTCLIGWVFPVDCQVTRKGAIGCAGYASSVQLADWEALRVIRRWRAMREYYVTQRNEVG